MTTSARKRQRVKKRRVRELEYTLQCRPLKWARNKKELTEEEEKGFVPLENFN